MQLHGGTSPYAMIQHSEALQMSPDRELISSLGKSQRIRNPQLSHSPSFSSRFQMSFPFQFSLGKTSPTEKAMLSFGQLDSLSEIQFVLQDRMRTTKFFWHSLPWQLREYTTFLSEVMFPRRQKTFSNAVHLKHFQGTAHLASLQNKNVIV